MDSLTLKCHNSFQNYKNGKATPIFAQIATRSFKSELYLHDLEHFKNGAGDKFG